MITLSEAYIYVSHFSAKASLHNLHLVNAIFPRIFLIFSVFPRAIIQEHVINAYHYKEKTLFLSIRERDSESIRKILSQRDICQIGLCRIYNAISRRAIS